MTLKKQLQDIITKHRVIVSGKENLFFLIDEWEIQKLIELLELKEKEGIAIIRSNAGLFEQKLNAFETIVFEPIQKIANVIEEEFPRENLKVINEAFGKGSVEKSVEKKFNKAIALQQPEKRTLFNLLKHDFEIIILLVNERFGEKLLAEPGFLDYGEETIMAQYHYNVNDAGRIDSDGFFPKPKSPIKIIKLVRKQKTEKAKDEELFEEFVRTIFRYKKKNLENALKNALKVLGNEKNFERVKKMKILKEKIYLLEVRELVKLFNEIF